MIDRLCLNGSWIDEKDTLNKYKLDSLQYDNKVHYTDFIHPSIAPWAQRP